MTSTRSPRWGSAFPFVLTQVLGCGGEVIVCGGEEACQVGFFAEDGCTFPEMAVDLTEGLPPMDTGSREVFDPDSYDGSDDRKFVMALGDAQAVEGAVVMNRVYELTTTPFIRSSVMLTGGGLRRSCSPVAVVTAGGSQQRGCLEVDTAKGFAPSDRVLLVVGPGWDDHIASFTVVEAHDHTICIKNPITEPVPKGSFVIRHNNLLSLTDPMDGIVIDSVLFDGANRCNDYTHDWRFNNAVTIRGSNVIRNSVFYDSPSESITSCGAVVQNNLAFDLQGSFIHKSCPTHPEPLDRIENNYVEGANLAGNEVMKHSEGLITFSANAGTIEATGNVFRHGREGVYGLAAAEDEGVSAVDDCYAHFPHVIEIYADASQAGFDFDVQLIDVPVIFKE